MLSLYFPKAADECAGKGKQIQGVDGNGQGVANIARIATVAADDNLGQRKTFDAAAVEIASGRDADFSNQVEIQNTDEDIEFDPGADEVAEGF